jgi:hypothetical protein
MRALVAVTITIDSAQPAPTGRPNAQGLLNIERAKRFFPEASTKNGITFSIKTASQNRGLSGGASSHSKKYRAPYDEWCFWD